MQKKMDIKNEFAPAGTKQEFQLLTASTTCLVGCTLSVSFCLEASVNFMEPLSEEQAVHGECIQQLENLVRQVGPGWEVKVGNSVEGVSRKDQKSTACHGLFPVC